MAKQTEHWASWIPSRSSWQARITSVSWVSLESTLTTWMTQRIRRTKCTSVHVSKWCDTLPILNYITKQNSAETGRSSVNVNLGLSVHMLMATRSSILVAKESTKITKPKCASNGTRPPPANARTAPNVNSYTKSNNHRTKRQRSINQARNCRTKLRLTLTALSLSIIRCSCNGRICWLRRKAVILVVPSRALSSERLLSNQSTRCISKWRNRIKSAPLMKIWISKG